MSEKMVAIYKALGNVMEGIGNIPKTGVMKFGNTSYNYLRADDVQERLNPLLRENNIIVQPKYEYSQTSRSVRAGNDGIDFVLVTLHMTYISTIDGSAIEYGPFVGEAQGGDDKSINKALTQALKNANRIIFQFASGEQEPDDVAPQAQKPEPKALAGAKRLPKPKTDVGGELATLKKQLQEWIGDDDARRTLVNDTHKAGKGTGLEGAALFKHVIETVGV